MSIKLTKIDSYSVRLPLKTPFKTSYGTLFEKTFDIIVLTDDQGHKGYGELTALETPDYIEETLDSSRLCLKKYLLPLLISEEIIHPSEVHAIFRQVKGNYMAKSALETAMWDLYAKQQNCSLTSLFKVTKKELAVGVSIGIEKDLDKLVDSVNNYIGQGYQRVKLKIQPGYDYQPLSAIRKAFPDLLLMADANSAYQGKDLSSLLSLDNLQLTMIEQPFSERDFVTHSTLQKQMTTRICLDENIRSLEDCQTAWELGSCQAINLKIPRVGGITSALEILDYCKEKELLVWLGGMYESGVGRALNLQFAAQDNFTFPGDLSASDRYFYEDIITVPHTINNGKIALPTGVGLGIELSPSRLERYGTHHLLWAR